MTLDEARLILNVKREEPFEAIVRNYDHLFKANSPPPPPEGPITAKARRAFHSHYLQSKVVRAKERLESEQRISEEAADSTKADNSEGPSPPPPNPPPPPPP